MLLERSVSSVYWRLRSCSLLAQDSVLLIVPDSNKLSHGHQSMDELWTSNRSTPVSDGSTPVSHGSTPESDKPPKPEYFCGFAAAHSGKASAFRASPFSFSRGYASAGGGAS